MARIKTKTLAEATLAGPIALAAATSVLPRRIRRDPPKHIKSTSGYTNVTGNPTCIPALNNSDELFWMDANAGVATTARFNRANLLTGVVTNGPVNPMSGVGTQALYWHAATNQLIMNYGNDVKVINQSTLAVGATLFNVVTLSSSALTASRQEVAIGQTSGTLYVQGTVGGATKIASFTLSPNAFVTVTSDLNARFNTSTNKAIGAHPSDAKVYVSDTGSRMERVNMDGSTDQLYQISADDTNHQKWGRLLNPSWPVTGSQTGEFTDDFKPAGGSGYGMAHAPDGHVYFFHNMIQANGFASAGTCMQIKNGDASSAKNFRVVIGKGDLPGQLFTPSESGYPSGGPFHAPLFPVFSPNGKWIAYMRHLFQLGSGTTGWHVDRCDKGTADWTFTFSSAGTIRHIAVPGYYGNWKGTDPDHDDRRPVKFYYKLGSGSFVEFTPGARLSAAVSAATGRTVRAEWQGWPNLTAIETWVGDDLSGNGDPGVSVIYDDSADVVTIGAQAKVQTT